MIRIYTVTAPLGDLPPQGTATMLNSALDRLRQLYPALIEAQACSDQGVLTLTIRVSARDQWACGTAARKIGSNMLLRARIPADQAQLQLVGTAPSARTLTAERGRSSGNGRPPAAKASEAI